MHISSRRRLGLSLFLWEGPFNLEVPLQNLLEFDQLPLPRRAAAIERLPSSKGKEEAPSESEGHSLDRYLTGERGAGLTEIMASVRTTNEESKAQGSEPKKPWNNLMPMYEVGELVTFYDRHEGEWRWWRAWVEKVILPTELQYRDGMVDILYQICPHPGEKIGNERMIRKEYRLRNSQEKDREVPKSEWHTSLPTHVGPLHSMEMVGIGTCSALSVSTRREDFLFLDSSKKATSSVVLKGVGGSDAKIGGRGPMVVLAEDDKGNEIVLIDPAGVYLEEAVDQADFRILGQLRMQKFGFDLVQNGDGDGMNHLIYKRGEVKIPLGQDSGILTLATKALTLEPDERESLGEVVDRMLEGERDDGDHCLRVTRSSLVLNETYLSKEELERLMHWRTAHRMSLKPGSKKDGLNEDCVICDEAKRKTKGYKRN